MERRLLYRYKVHLYRYRACDRTQMLSGLALYRPIVSTVEDFVADVAPRAVRAHVLPGRCEEAGRGCVFAVPVAAPLFIAVEVVLLRWCRHASCSSTDQLVWIEPDSRNGAGTGVFTVPGTGMSTVPIGLGQI
uniref:Uncharacterized protein n=1 Tax=Ananas comosus var. bracteatus TaxID=296719 RepID=A0A6V7NPX1_ANACO|nr:unnamed protein product [Ananas comosus var. bracteatus]